MVVFWLSFPRRRESRVNLEKSWIPDQVWDDKKEAEEVLEDSPQITREERPPKLLLKKKKPTEAGFSCWVGSCAKSFIRNWFLR